MSNLFIGGPSSCLVHNFYGYLDVSVSLRRWLKNRCGCKARRRIQARRRTSLTQSTPLLLRPASCAQPLQVATALLKGERTLVQNAQARRSTISKVQRPSASIIFPLRVHVGSRVAVGALTNGALFVWRDRANLNDLRLDVRHGSDFKQTAPFAGVGSDDDVSRGRSEADIAALAAASPRPGAPSPCDSAAAACPRNNDVRSRKPDWHGQPAAAR